jgi:small subunit ribosomal protein S20
LAQAAPKRKPSVLKRARQSEKRNQRNRVVISKVKTYTKKVHEALESGDGGEVEKALRQAVKQISSAASKGVLHRNTASRKISRLSKKVNDALKSKAA